MAAGIRLKIGSGARRASRGKGLSIGERREAGFDLYPRGVSEQRRVFKSNAAYAAVTVIVAVVVMELGRAAGGVMTVGAVDVRGSMPEQAGHTHDQYQHYREVGSPSRTFPVFDWCMTCHLALHSDPGCGPRSSDFVLDSRQADGGPRCPACLLLVPIRS